MQQLAGLLQKRQIELDRRESNILARQAELEQNKRSFQFWIREQHELLENRGRNIGTRAIVVLTRGDVGFCRAWFNCRAVNHGD